MQGRLFNTWIHEGLFCSDGERVVKSGYLYIEIVSFKAL